MANIQPIEFKIGTATQIKVDVVSYSTADVFYQLLTPEGIVCKFDSYTLTPSEYSSWQSNSVTLEQLVASMAGITLV